MITNAIYDYAHSGDLERMRAWLTNKPAALNEPVGDGYTALHVACLFGHERLVTLLLAHGALVNVNADNASGATPLHVAVMFRDEEVAVRMASALLDNGAELNAPQKGGQTPLHHAVGRGSLTVSRFLVEAGADPFMRDEQGRSPKDVAASLKDGAEEMGAVFRKAFALN